MKKKSWLYGGVLLGTLAILIWTGAPDSAAPAVSANPAAALSEGGSLVAEVMNYNFGTVSMRKGNVVYQYRLKNTGTDPVTITRLYTSCMCTTATLEINGDEIGPFGMQGHGVIPRIKEVVAPGQEAIVTATFDPNAHGPAGVGRIARVITLENSAGDPVELNFEATVTP